MGFKLNKKDFNFGEGTNNDSPNKIKQIGKQIGKRLIPGVGAVVLAADIYEGFSDMAKSRNAKPKKLSDYDFYGNKKVEAIFKSKFPEKYKEAQRLEKEYQEKQNPELKEKQRKATIDLGKHLVSGAKNIIGKVKNYGKNVIETGKNVTENIKDNKAENKTSNKNNKTKSTSYDKAYKNRDMKTYGKMSKAEYIKEAKRQKAIYDKTGKWDVKKQY